MSEPARGPFLTSPIDAALDDLERALRRDGSHVVVTAPAGPEKGALARGLAERLGRALRLVHLSPGEVDEAEVCARVLARLRERGGVRPEAAPAAGETAETRLTAVASGLAAQGSAVVLLIEDAMSIPPAALRRLGALAAASGGGLRLALFVAADVPIGTLVVALGTGVQKVVLDLPRKPAGRGVRSAVRAVAASPAEAAVAPAPRARPRAESAGDAARGRRAAWVALAGGAVVLLGASLPAATAWIEARPAAAERDVSTAPRAGGEESGAALAKVEAERADEAEVADVAAKAPAGEADGAVAETRDDASANPVPDPPIASVAPDAAAQPAAGAAEATRDAAEATAAAEPPPTVAVSFNASPWARVAIDGREIGVTPLGDVPLTPGTHHVRAELPNGSAIERDLHIDAYRNHFRLD